MKHCETDQTLHYCTAVAEETEPPPSPPWATDWRRHSRSC